MSPERFDALLNNWKELGPNSEVAIFAYSDENENMIIQFPNEKGDSDTQIASKLAKIFSTVLSTAEKKNQRTYTIVRDAMASAVLPHVNGMNDSELTARALLRL